MTHLITTDLVDLLQSKSESLPDRPAFRFLLGSNPQDGYVEWSYRELDARARRLAARLQRTARPGDRALLAFTPGLDFLTGFFGCLYAGLIAVPVHPPDPKRLTPTLPRMRAIARDAGASLVITTVDMASAKGMLSLLAPDLARLEWIAADNLGAGDETSWMRPRIDPDDVAFLQYTSGTTGDPRGVALTHTNVLANQRAMMLAAKGAGERDVVVDWMPLVHDFGLIGATLHAAYTGALSILMSPALLSKDPLSWLRAISHFGATVSGGPDFMFARCARAATEADVEALALDSWRVAFCGGEPIRAQTIEEFSRVFEPAGFCADAFMPAYGLAEATSIVTRKPRGTPPRILSFDRKALECGRAEQSTSPAARAIVSCGSARAYDVRIVDPQRCVDLPEGTVGEIWVRGKGVAREYWNQHELSRAVFAAKLESGEEYLRTGDLGFMLDGELFVCGRMKDMIIIAGRNIDPQDVERTAEAASLMIRRGCAAAFAIDDRIAIVAEADGPEEELNDAHAVVCWAITASFGVTVDRVVFVKPRTMPRTSSGKIQRAECKREMLEGALELSETGPSHVAAEPVSEVVQLVVRTRPRRATALPN